MFHVMKQFLKNLLFKSGFCKIYPAAWLRHHYLRGAFDLNRCSYYQSVNKREVRRNEKKAYKYCDRHLCITKRIFLRCLNARFIMDS